jgi:hypothetical protein
MSICFQHDVCKIGDGTGIVRPLVTKKTNSVARVLTVAKATPFAILTASIGIVALVGCGGDVSMMPVATPTFTPGAGTYNTSQTVTIASLTSGSVLYCTVDGSTPTASSPQCSEPLTVSKSETVSVIAIAPGQAVSPVATAAYTINLPNAAVPVFSPAAGTYTTAQSVTITDTIGGALIYYTTDGSTPTTTSTPYNSPITISSTETINAIAVASGYGVSAEATALYTINPPAPSPTIGAAGGSTTTTYGAPLSVTLADTDPNATIYYAINTPATTASTRYTGPISVSMSETINAVAIDLPGGFSQSAMSSQAFTALDAPPVFSKPSGAIPSGTQITISDADPAASIYYSIGTAAQPTSTLYAGPITVTGSEAINAIAIDAANNYAQSVSSSVSYTVPAQTPTPTILSAGGSSATYPSSLSVTITDSDSNALIYYTTDGTTPSQTHGTQYTGSLTVSETETVSAIAIDVAGQNSASSPAARQFTILEAVPVFSPSAVAVASGTRISITDADSKAAIYYTTNGSAATTASTLYTGPISIISAETINAVAVDSNPGTSYAQSMDASAAYTLQSAAPTPVIASAAGTSATYPSKLSVTITDTDGTATIYYTTDDSTPSTTHGSQYSGPITVSSTETVTAIAIDSSHGYGASASASQLYTVTEATPAISPSAGTVSSGTQVSINDADPAATIFYTTNGSHATTSSTRYTGPIAVTSPETINAVAIDTIAATNYVLSADASSVYAVQAPTPAIRSPGGTSTTYPANFSVSISDSDANATVYYTTDGSTPSATHGAQYTAPFIVSSTETVMAIALDSSHGYAASSTASQFFSVREATPSISPPAGTIGSGTQVMITDADPGAAIYYTTNGSQATTLSTRYTGLLTVTASETVNAVAADTTSGSIYTQSLDTSAAYSLVGSAPVPVISSAAGTSTTYPGTLSVTITDSDTNATIYFTTDGSAPSTTHGTEYTGAVSLASTETITAIAVDASHGYSNSALASQAFTVVEAKPVMAPAAGAVASGTSVTITDADPGATIYYTTNGSPANTSSTRYTGAIAITTAETVNAIAIDTAASSDYVQSADTSAAYTLQSPAPTPVIASASDTSATYPSRLTVTISDTDATATIYYTTDGSTPSATHGSQYSGPITVSSTETIAAVSIDSSHGFTSSAVSAQLFTIAEAKPTIAPAAGAVTSGTQVTITDADPGATIYYTTNGSPANTSSTPYTGAITLSAAETINSVAIDATASYTVSQDVSAAYTIVAQSTPTPVISSASGTAITYPSTFSVSITDTDASATIYYTTDGSTPSATNGTQYTGNLFTVSSTQTVSAIAIASSTSSTVATQLFTIQEAEPQFSPPAGIVSSSGASIVITDTDSNATIYYTTSGNPATTSSTQYTGPISVSSATTINAVAIDTTAGSNYTLSTDESAAYSLCPAHSICGSVKSGNLPIDGATVQLYAAGKTGYGAGATALSTTPSTITTNAAGGFSLNSPTCPSAPGDQLYLVATGGSTSGGSSETNIALMVTLGTCSELASVTSVTINEVTTTASAYALSGFAAPNGSGRGIVVGAPAPSSSCTETQIGNSTCNYIGLVNAFRTVNNLVNTTSGTPLTVTEFYSGSDPNNLNGWSSSYGDPSGACPGANCLSPNNPVPSDPISGMPYQADTYQALNTSLVPFQRLNTLGNVLASCVEEQGNCAGLSTLTNGAADTLQAALYIAQHPGAWNPPGGNPNGKLYNQIATPAVIFTPPYGDGTSKTTLTAEPNDWTLAISFTGAGLGVNPQVDSTDSLTNQQLAIDAYGNVWVTAAPVAQANSGFAYGMVAGFDPLGEALTPATSLVGGVVNADPNTYYSTFGGFGPNVSDSGNGNGNPGLGLFGQDDWFAIDTSSSPRFWVANTGQDNGSFDPGGVKLIESSSAAPGAANNIALGSYSSNVDDGQIVFDQSKDLWQPGGSGFVFDYGTSGSSSSEITVQGPSIPNEFCNMLFDSQQTIWVDDCGDGAGGQVTAVYPGTITPNTNVSVNASGNYTGAFTSSLTSNTLVAGSGGTVYACSANQTGYLKFNVTQNPSAPFGSFAVHNNRCGIFLTADGAGNIWSYSDNGVYNGLPGLDEVTGGGSQLSPDAGFTANSTDEVSTTGISAFNRSAYGDAGGISVDGSGNLWFLNAVAGAPSGGVGSPVSNALVEFIGIAAPTVTPTALATQNGVQATMP